MKTFLIFGHRPKVLSSEPQTPVKKQKEDIAQVPFLLPHEIVHAVLQWTDLDHFADVAHLPTDERSLLETGKEIIGRNLPLLPLGLWMDVPCNWDRSHSLNVLTINFPSACGAHRNMRIPLFGLKQHFCCKHKTFDAVFEVVCWSLRLLFLGTMPSCRHDGQPFSASDTARKRWAQKSLPRCMLTQVRGLGLNLSLHLSLPFVGCQDIFFQIHFVFLFLSPAHRRLEDAERCLPAPTAQ